MIGNEGVSEVMEVGSRGVGKVTEVVGVGKTLDNKVKCSAILTERDKYIEEEEMPEGGVDEDSDILDVVSRNVGMPLAVDMDTERDVKLEKRDTEEGGVSIAEVVGLWEDDEPELPSAVLRSTSLPLLPLPPSLASPQQVSESVERASCLKGFLKQGFNNFMWACDMATNVPGRWPNVSYQEIQKKHFSITKSLGSPTICSLGFQSDGCQTLL